MSAGLVQEVPLFTDGYLAPEVIVMLLNNYHGLPCQPLCPKAADIYALGIVFWQLWSNGAEFPGSASGCTVGEVYERLQAAYHTREVRHYPSLSTPTTAFCIIPGVE